MNPRPLIEFLRARADHGRTAALLAVTAADGESPGRPGFLLAVAADGLCGTVGGGEVERAAIERARRKLAAPPSPPEAWRAVHRERDAEASGLICGGEQTLALHLCGPADRSVLAAWQAAVEQPDGAGALTLSPAGLAFEPAARLAAPDWTGGDGPDWRFRAPAGFADTVFIVGGGHVGLALSRLLAGLDVRIVVLDERMDISTLRDNVWAHRLIRAPFAEAAAHIPEGDRHYAVIMTPGHRADETVLRALAGRHLRYLGLMGSATKIRALFARLERDGVPAQALARVHAPVGVSIGSRTPEEIAISIAAEIIRERNIGPLSAPSGPGG